MNLNLFNLDKDKSVSNNKNSNFISSFISELKEHLNNSNIISENISNTVSDVKNFINRLQNNPSLKNDTYIIDRFEGEETVYAVCQNSRTGKMYDIPKIDLPKEIEEGSVLKISNDKFVRNYETEEILRKEIQKIRKDLVSVSNLKWNPILSKDSYKIERFEGSKTEYAVCENLRTNETFNILKNELPTEAKENSIVKIVGNEYVLDNKSSSF